MMDAISQPAQANEHAIDTIELTKKFGSFTAVDRVTFRVRRGEIFGFLGPNGAGKTTTMRMLMGLLPPTAGSATIMGLDIVSQKAEVHKRIGYMSQRFTLYNDLTVRENLNFFGGAYGVRGQRLEKRRAEILDMAGLSGRERELTKNLSGGWRQRLALGCAILHEPQLLFLDEPTAGVDPISRREFWDLLYTLSNQGRTIFVTTHYMDEAEHCHRLAFIQDGRLGALGSPEAIKRDQMQGQVMEIDCAAPDRALSILREKGWFREVSLYGALIHVVVDDAAAYKRQVRELLGAKEIAVRSLHVIAPSLEDVFIATVAQGAGSES
jgi:ABC-2 type transport system ATP-binding protein